jgi:hypothetical protein
MGLFDGLADAFSNDDTLGERKEAGLKSRVQRVIATCAFPRRG